MPLRFPMKYLMLLVLFFQAASLHAAWPIIGPDPKPITDSEVTYFVAPDGSDTSNGFDPCYRLCHDAKGD
ncbi:MAG: hypothetical protein HC898_00410 [Phycisphaerales bacterium]|nr:hypothetical protein [Phycisphaerales bacterium]